MKVCGIKTGQKKQYELWLYSLLITAGTEVMTLHCDIPTVGKTTQLQYRSQNMINPDTRNESGHKHPHTFRSLEWGIVFRYNTM